MEWKERSPFTRSLPKYATDFMMKDRIVLITGATRGLGIGIAEAFAKAGAKVAMNYANDDIGAARAKEEVSKHGIVELFKADAFSEGGVKSLVEQVSAQWGAIDTLVLNATPAQYEKEIKDYSEGDFESMFRAFVMGPHYLTRAVVPEMKKRQFGRIIHITSEVFQCGSAPFSAYVAGKGGQIGYLRSTAMELAPFGITVNSVAPGWIPVERHESISEEGKNNYLQTIPVGRWGTVEDVAEAVRFFAENHSGFLTGQMLAVNGGRTLS